MRYTTYDVYIAAFLIMTLSRQPELEMNSRGIVVFSFKEDGELLAVLKEYNENAPCVAVVEFVGTVKGLKARMFQLKDEVRRENLKSNFN